MIAHIAIGSALSIASICILSGFLASAVIGLERWGKWISAGREHPGFFRTTASLAVTTIWILAGISLAAWMWAAAFILLGVFNALEPALYFSVVTLTTLGYGDIVLDEQWRLLAGFQAANGLVLFGLLTAFLFKLLDKIRHQ